MHLRSRNRSDLKRRRQVMQQQIRKQLLMAILRDVTLLHTIRQYFQIRVSELDRNVHCVRIRNRCIWSARSRGVLTRFRCSRIIFRQLAGQAQMMGIRKASW